MATRAACRRRCVASAFAEAGADALYAPGLRKAEDVAEVVRVAGKLPVNYLAFTPALTFKQIEDLGVRRISVGAALARVAWEAFMRAAKEIAEKGVFDAFAPGGSFGELQKLFAGRGRYPLLPASRGEGGGEAAG